jgi:hypothetical protein
MQRIQCKVTTSLQAGGKVKGINLLVYWTNNFQRYLDMGWKVPPIWITENLNLFYLFSIVIS